MNNIFVEFLPPWVETGMQPAFYDKESGTVLQQTARMYAKVNELVQSVNHQNETIDNYIEQFDELHSYVYHYFDTLDVQDEVDHKLDEMAESGELADIIAEYIQLRGVLAYDSISAMKLADNLSDGSFIETYGFYTKGDGGGAKYKVREVTNVDTVDETTLFALANESLVAELMPTPTMNVKQFGAKGDGTTDETTLFNKIFAYTHTNNVVKTIVLPKGTFNISDTVNIYSNLNLIGDGAGNTTIKFTSNAVTGANNHYLLYFNNSSNLVVRGIKFEGVKDPTSYSLDDTRWWHGLFFSYSSNITVENCTFNNFFTSGITIRNSSNVYINDNDFSGNGWNDIAMTRLTDNIKITNNRFNDIVLRGVNAEDGSFDQPVTNTLISGNTFKTQSTTVNPVAINFSNASLSGNQHRYTGITITNNNMYGLWVGISLKFVKDVFIANNIISCARGIDGSYANMTDFNENLEIVNNIITATHSLTTYAHYCYNLPKANEIKFKNNICYSDDNANLNLTFYLAKNVEIAGNTIEGGSHALRGGGESYCKNFRIHDNEIKNSSSYGISLYAGDVTIKNNKITNTGGSGIKLEGGFSNFAIEGNYLFNNTAYGIEFPTGSTGNKFAVIRNNWFGEDRETPVMTYACYANVDIDYVIIENTYLLSTLTLKNGSHWGTNCTDRNNDGFGTLPE